MMKPYSRYSKEIQDIEMKRDFYLSLLYDLQIDLNGLSNDCLDAMYYIANGDLAFHLTRQAYIDNLNKFRTNNIVI